MQHTGRFDDDLLLRDADSWALDAKAATVGDEHLLPDLDPFDASVACLVAADAHLLADLDVIEVGQEECAGHESLSCNQPMRPPLPCAATASGFVSPRASAS